MIIPFGDFRPNIITKKVSWTPWFVRPSRTCTYTMIIYADWHYLQGKTEKFPRA